MATLEQSSRPQPVSIAQQESDLFACAWDQDMEAAGIEHEQSAAIRYGAPGLALVMLAAAALIAIANPDSGRSVAPLALGLLAVAALPWLDWLVRGDRGPTWTNVTLILAPILALGIGQWFWSPLDLGSDAAWALLAFPGLLVVVMVVAIADVPISIGAVAGTWLSYGAPMAAAAIAGKDVDLAGLMTWHVGFALAIVAGYAARLSYSANQAISAAREALARQEAAEERRRVARDVHDVVAHTLAVTMLHITAARMAVKREDADAAVTALEEAERQGRASLADVRRMVRFLRADDAAALDVVQPGLADVEALVEGYRTAGLPVRLSYSNAAHRPAPVAELAIYRVLQEALTNVARHGASPATVDLEASAQGLRLRVENPVRGTVPARSRGSGLPGMRERIAAAGGSVEAGIQNGLWVVQAMVPGEAAS